MRKAASFDRAVDQLIEKVFAPPTALPAVLYHYTGTGGFEGIVGSRCVHATEYRRFEDEHELRHADQFVHAIAESRLSTSGQVRATKFLTRFIEQYGRSATRLLLERALFQKPEHGRLTSLPHFEAHVACFSREVESPYLWEHYGENGQGYCIGINTIAEAFPEVTDVHSSMLEIEYDAESCKKRIERAFDAILRRVQRNAHSADLDEAALAVWYVSPSLPISSTRTVAT